MADAFNINENSATKTSLYAIWRLTRVMTTAGWTVSRSSNGTTFNTSDNWTTYAGLGNSSWIVLNGPGSRQIMFWRGTSSTQTGKVVYAKSGSWPYSGTYGATDPGTFPATAQYVRGDSVTFVNWLGATDSTAVNWFVQAAAKDISDGSFYVVVGGGDGTQGHVVHMLSFWSLTKVDSADTDPYAFCTTNTSPTGNTGSANGLANIQGETSVSGTGYWVGWARNTDWKAFAPAIQYKGTSSGTVISDSSDNDPYNSGAAFLEPVLLIKSAEPLFRERKGWPNYMRRVGNFTSGNSYASSTYAAIQTNAVLFWDGATATASL